DAHLVGEVLDERYQLLNIIAQGSISTVFRAKDLTDDISVAVKILFDTIDDTDIRGQFKSAASDICAFSHANVARILHLGLTPTGRPYFVLPQIIGLTLSQCIDDQQSLSEDDVLDIFPQVADALLSMHQHNLIYRALKPTNIMLTTGESDTVKVMLLDY